VHAAAALETRMLATRNRPITHTTTVCGCNKVEGETCQQLNSINKVEDVTCHGACSYGASITTFSLLFLTTSATCIGLCCQLSGTQSGHPKRRQQTNECWAMTNDNNENGIRMRMGKIKVVGCSRQGCPTHQFSASVSFTTSKLSAHLTSCNIHPTCPMESPKRNPKAPNLLLSCPQPI
jgi:hypothetical protein